MKESCFKGCFCSKAFTLIELLVVVLIIGILAAVAVPQYQKAVKKARLTQWATYFNNYAKAIDVWLVANGYPAETILFSGNGEGTTKYADLDIDFPKTREDTDVDYTKIGYFHVGCDVGYCWINFRSTGTEESPILPAWDTFYVNKVHNEPWLLNYVPSDTTARKWICQFWKENFGIDRMRETPKANCAAVGIE